MGELLLVAFLGGLITGLSPCIVPVIPVVMAGGSTSTSRWRPYVIIAGVVVSFSLSVLFASSLLSLLHLPQDLLFWLGVALLAVLSISLLVPKVGEVIERPFTRLGASRYATEGGGFVLGLSLGLVFVPCAGPVLTAISVAAAHHRVSASSLFVTLAYALGVTVPLLVLAVIAQRATSWSVLRGHLPAVRKVAGVVLGVTTAAIAFNWLGALQRAVPGYTSALENHIESNGSACDQLRRLSGERQNQFAAANARLEGKQATCANTDAGNSSSSRLAAGATPTAGHATTTTMVGAGARRSGGTPPPHVFMASKTDLPALGRAPDFTGITTWFNTPQNQPLSLAQLRGKVVLVDFWTYSCINCQRSLPHVEAWYNRYRSDGLVVVGVSAPEFAFERVVSNVERAAGNLGVDYPVAVDDNLATWSAYNNQYWPAEYLIDPTGTVRAYSFGEGDYGTMEGNIRMLLAADGVSGLPPRTDVPDRTPTSPAITPESYVGYDRMSNSLDSPAVDATTDDRAVTYHPPNDLPANNLSFGGTWTVHHEEATAGKNATLALRFTADDIYLVMSGQGTVGVSVDGRPVAQVPVSGIPKLYTLLAGTTLRSGVLTLQVPPGVEAYDFTFG